MASMADKLIAWNFSTNPTTPSHLLERKNKEDQVLFDDDFLLPSHELSKAPSVGMTMIVMMMMQTTTWTQTIKYNT